MPKSTRAKRWNLDKLPAKPTRHLQQLEMQVLAEHFPTDFRVMGFDLAKFKTGWTVIDCETHGANIESHLGDMGLITCPKSLTTCQSMPHIYMQLMAVIEKYKPDIICYENVSVVTQPAAFKSLSKTEALMQLASTMANPGGSLMVPFSPIALKKIALGRNKPDMAGAKTLAESQKLTWGSLDKTAKGKLAIMHAAELSFGVAFTDDNVCDSFLAAMGGVYLARLLYKAQIAELTEEFDDKKMAQFLKNEWCEKEAAQYEVVESLMSKTYILKENCPRDYQKIFDTVSGLYRPVSIKPDIEGDDSESDSDD